MIANELGFAQGDGYCTTGRTYVPYDTVIYNFQIQTLYNLYIRYPDSIISALIKIGGLIAILKIGTLMNIVHGIQYQRQIREIAHKEKERDRENSNDCAEKKFTLENFQKMIDTSSAH